MTGRMEKGRGAGYAELGMAAIWRIEVEDFPAFIVARSNCIAELT